MKLKSIVLSFVFAATISSAFANTGIEEKRSTAERNFKTEFTTASNVEWSRVGQFNKVTFSMNGQELYAFYTTSGERVALARNVHVNALPINLYNDVRAKYSKYWITEAFELSKDGDSAYYVAVENADEKVLLKSINMTQWMVYKTTTKE